MSFGFIPFLGFEHPFTWLSLCLSVCLESREKKGKGERGGERVRVRVRKLMERYVGLRSQSG